MLNCIMMIRIEEKRITKKGGRDIIGNNTNGN